MNVKKFFMLSILLVFFATLVSAVPDVNVVSPQAAETYSVGTTVTIDFNVSDIDNNRLTMDLNYSLTTAQGSGTVIVHDLNLAKAYCPDQIWDNTDANFGSSCTYSWDTTGVPAGCYTVSNSGSIAVTACNYYILADVNNFSFTAPLGSAFDAGNSYFTITKISDVNIALNRIGDIVNNATTLGDFVMGGVKDQGGLIGLAIGLSIAITLLIALIFTVIAVIPKVIDNVKRIK